jgi:hypothetical protein
MVLRYKQTEIKILPNKIRGYDYEASGKYGIACAGFDYAARSEASLIAKVKRLIDKSFQSLDKSALSRDALNTYLKDVPR